MIQISVRGINLPIKDEVVEREYETNVFDRELKGSDFTLPFTVALTDDVKKAIGFTHLPEAFNIENDIDALLNISGVISVSVTLKILDISNVDQTMTISIIGDYGSFASFLGDRRLRTLHFDGDRIIGSVQPSQNVAISLPGYSTQISYTPCDSYLHMLDVARGDVITDYVFYPCIDENPNIPGVHVDGGNSLINTFIGIDGADEYYPDPILQNIYYFFKDNAITNDKYFWVPQFRLWYVLKKCFEEIAFTIYTTLFDDDNFKKIVLHNTYAINQCVVDNISLSGFTYIEHQATRIKPQNHVPNVTIAEFLIETGKAFNLQFNIDWTNRRVEIQQLSTYIPTPELIFDISKNVAPDPDVEFDSDIAKNGFEFVFEGVAETKDDIAKFTNRGVFNDIAELAASVTTVAINDVAYLRTLNTWVQWNGSSWVDYSYNLGSYKSTDNDNLQKISCKMQPLPQKNPFPINYVRYGSLDLAGALPDNNWPILPASSIGMEGLQLLTIEKIGDALYIGNTDAQVENENIYICNWLGMQRNSNFDTNYGPLASNSQSDVNGNRPGVSISGHPALNPELLGAYDLVWHTPENSGLFEMYRDFANKVTNSRLFKYQVYMDATLYQRNLDTAWFVISGQLYRCAKARLQLPLPSIGELTLRRL